MIPRVTSLIRAVCFVIFLVFIGTVIFVVNSVRKGSGLEMLLGKVQRPVIESYTNVLAASVVSKMENSAGTLYKNGYTDVVLNEVEASYLLNNLLKNSDNNIYSILHDLQFDFEKEGAILFADVAGGATLSFDLQVKNYDDKVIPEVSMIRIGKVKLPFVIRDKVNDLIYQGIEQLKTDNFGGFKIKDIRLLTDSSVIRLGKI